eukprot:CAMPEP_0201282566 /NCGR_PEP_ID=MMETSP1317-20130820/6014_1 /ASSEMBLY_ACC=CAM_ASM_000770 /TAXON_ID=187299 /ORGANISM="Undescribed Undescribed, Strain Undescribed" /LENGTH=65 /DNA_ID=CAMNT_0047595675 /DNA_START=1008 /DNA_END=1205 /DNA_ORIENTATION=+
MKQLFTALDENGDGVLSKEELLKGYQQHMSRQEAETEVERIFQEVDTDGSGAIDFTEFITATMNR